MQKDLQPPVEEDPWRELPTALAELEATLRSRHLERPNFLRDSVALDLAVQVLEAGHGVMALLDTRAIRLAYPAARYALEAAEDVLFLLLIAEEPERLAARALVTSWRAALRTDGLMRTAMAASGATPPSPEASLKRMVEEDASQMEQLVPSAAAALRAAAANDAEGEWHWSGLTRQKLQSRLKEALEAEGIGETFVVLYDYLATRSHPRFRVGEAATLSPSAYHLVLTPPGPDSLVAWVTWASVASVSTALKEHIPQRIDADPAGSAS